MPESDTRAGLTIEKFGCMAGYMPLFESLDVTLESGQWLRITGPNGTGKTTLLRAIAGLVRPHAGQMRWQNAPVQTQTSEWRQHILYQGHAPALKDNLSAAQNLALWLALDHGHSPEPANVERLLRDVGLNQRRAVPAARLSAGQRRRIQLARLSASQRAIWLLDEPSNALDQDGQALLCRLVSEHLIRGGCAVIATHQTIPITAPPLELDMASVAFRRRDRSVR